MVAPAPRSPRAHAAGAPICVRPHWSGNTGSFTGCGPGFETSGGAPLLYADAGYEHVAALAGLARIPTAATRTTAPSATITRMGSQSPGVDLPKNEPGAPQGGAPDLTQDQFRSRGAP